MRRWELEPATAASRLLLGAIPPISISGNVRIKPCANRATEPVYIVNHKLI